jgi:hypothetical protein
MNITAKLTSARISFRIDAASVSLLALLSAHGAARWEARKGHTTAARWEEARKGHTTAGDVRVLYQHFFQWTQNRLKFRAARTKLPMEPARVIVTEQFAAAVVRICSHLLEQIAIHIAARRPKIPRCRCTFVSQQECTALRAFN